MFAQGGKGATSRKTPTEILDRCERLAVEPRPLLYASRMAAKVDSAAVQDGYQLCHHAFFFTRRGHWCVVQQGMSDRTRTARRYHWLSEALTNFVNAPHQAICSDARGETLNLSALGAAVDLRPRTCRLRVAAWSGGRRRTDAAGTCPCFGDYLWHSSEHARSRAIHLCPRRKGRKAVPGRSRDLRPHDRHTACSDGAGAGRSVGQDRCAEAALALCAIERATGWS